MSNDFQELVDIYSIGEDNQADTELNERQQDAAAILKECTEVEQEANLDTNYNEPTIYENTFPNIGQYLACFNNDYSIRL